MLVRIFAIGAIFAGTTVAWMILAGSISSRTNDSNEKLKTDVSSTWGTPQVQIQPSAIYTEERQIRQESQVDGKKVVSTQTANVEVPLAAESSRVHADLALEYRQKGLLWYSVYVVNFSGTYTFRNPTDQPRLMLFQLMLPSKQAIYDGLEMDADGNQLAFTAGNSQARANVVVQPGQAVAFRAAYRSQGMESWRYNLGDDVTQTHNFELTMHTNFAEIDFPANTLSPTEKHADAQGWNLTWRYRNLISGFQIGMTMPEKLQPGPLAGDISRFAPVSLLLFFFVMFILTTIRGIDLHPMNYFFLAAAFFSFHLLLAYLADHVAIGAGFVICSAVSVTLVVSYLRLVIGARFAILEAGVAQLVYLVLFSATFFLQGFTGLAITIGCIVTLFIAMQVTAKIRWSDKFRAVSPTPRPDLPPIFGG